MSDGVVFADILAVAQDLVVVRCPQADGAILGVCRMPSAAAMPAATWFTAVDGTTLPLIAHPTAQGLVVEAVIAGTPLAVRILGTGTRSLSSEDYPWTAWSRASGTAQWTARLVHDTHLLLGLMVVALLLIAISTRRRAHVAAPPPGSPLTVGRIARSAVGGMLGFGRDSFTRFPPPPRGADGGRHDQ